MLIAEELECDWSKVRAEHAPAADVYKFPMFGMQMTGGSSSTYGEFDRYRTVGATAKHLLLEAAAKRLHTTPDRLTVDKGVITFGKQTLTYGQVAEEAMKLPQPAAVKLKDPKDWKVIGHPTKRLDSPEKIDGTAKFGMDVQFPGLRTAMVARPPAFGAKLVSFDDSAALAVRGVEKVVRTTDGVAVVAKNFWAAKLGRDALKIQWQAAGRRRRQHHQADRRVPRPGEEAGRHRHQQGGRRARRWARPPGRSRSTTASPTSLTLRWSRSTAR